MRDFKIQALLNYLKIIPQHELTLKQWLLYGLGWVSPLKKSLVSTTKIFDLDDFPLLKESSIKIANNDPEYFPRLFEPQTLGIRTWEYGVMLTKINFNGKKSNRF